MTRIFAFILRSLKIFYIKPQISSMIFIDDPNSAQWECGIARLDIRDQLKVSPSFDLTMNDTPRSHSLLNLLGYKPTR